MDSRKQCKNKKKKQLFNTDYNKHTKHDLLNQIIK